MLAIWKSWSSSVCLQHWYLFSHSDFWAAAASMNQTDWTRKLNVQGATCKTALSLATRRRLFETEGRLILHVCSQSSPTPTPTFQPNETGDTSVYLWEAADLHSPKNSHHPPVNQSLVNVAIHFCPFKMKSTVLIFMPPRLQMLYSSVGRANTIAPWSIFHLEAISVPVWLCDVSF